MVYRKRQRTALTPPTVIHKKTLPLLFELQSLDMETVSVDQVNTTFEKMRSPRAHERMCSSARAELRKFLKKEGIKDWTK
jgi:hypothetical protein